MQGFSAGYDRVEPLAKSIGRAVHLVCSNCLSIHLALHPHTTSPPILFLPG